MKNSLKDSLFDNGLLEEGDVAKIQAFKKQYHKDYNADYQKQYQKKVKRKTLVFSKEQFSFIEDEAEKHGMKVSPFLKSVIFAYLESSFVFPNGKTLSNIEVLLREINQRVAESIQYVHLNEKLELKDIEDIKKRIQQLEFFISETLSNPPRLSNWIANQVEKDKMFIPKLHQALATFITLHL